MLQELIGRVFGTRHERERKRVQPIIENIKEIEQELASLSDEEIQAQTSKFRERIAERTAPIEERIAELKQAKRTTEDAAERESLDTELQGVDGRGGAEEELRNAIVLMLFGGMVYRQGIFPTACQGFVDKQGFSRSDYRKRLFQMNMSIIAGQDHLVDFLQYLASTRCFYSHCTCG